MVAPIYTTLIFLVSIGLFGLGLIVGSSCEKREERIVTTVIGAIVMAIIVCFAVGKYVL